MYDPPCSLKSLARVFRILPARHYFAPRPVSSEEMFSEGRIKRFRRVIRKQICEICSIVP